uniref:Uncharacterized protein n=1 Tax=Rhizophora mucronata TaxID=61149 RepID=A0A2P2QTI1_RHIMU
MGYRGMSEKKKSLHLPHCSIFKKDLLTSTKEKWKRICSTDSRSLFVRATG